MTFRSSAVIPPLRTPPPAVAAIVMVRSRSCCRACPHAPDLAGLHHGPRLKRYIAEEPVPIRLLALRAAPSPAGSPHPRVQFVATHKGPVNRSAAKQDRRLHETLARGTIAGNNSLGRPEKAVTGFPQPARRK